MMDTTNVGHKTENFFSNSVLGLIASKCNVRTQFTMFIINFQHASPVIVHHIIICIE